jgi:hypothetical protein
LLCHGSVQIDFGGVNLGDSLSREKDVGDMPAHVLIYQGNLDMVPGFIVKAIEFGGDK